MAVDSSLSRLSGYPFEVRYSAGAVVRTKVSAGLAVAAYVYVSRLLSAITPDVAIVVVDETDWTRLTSGFPYGLPLFNDEAGQIRPGVVTMPAGVVDFWIDIAQDLRATSPSGYVRLRVTYPDVLGGVQLQPVFDLISINELGHAFQMLGDLRLPTSWLGEIFANLALHAFIATQRPERLPTLEVLPTVGAGSRRLAIRMRSEGYSTLEELQAHYPGRDDSMDPELLLLH